MAERPSGVGQRPGDELGPPGPDGAPSSGQPDGGPPEEHRRPVDVEETFDRTVTEGTRRLSRPWAPLVATGLVGGTDVATGVLAYLLVLHASGPAAAGHLWAGLAFSAGFIALTLARSELFTENFLVPVITVVVKQATARSLLRLWSVTLLANLASGWLITGLIMAGFPALTHTAIEAGGVYVGYGTGWRSFALALLAGAILTLMTWMQHGFESYGVKLVPAVIAGFLLGAGSMNHAVVSSLLIFCGLHAGASAYGYLAWAETAGWATLGNLAGGIALVTLLRLLQAPHQVQRHRERTPPAN